MKSEALEGRIPQGRQRWSRTWNSASESGRRFVHHAPNSSGRVASEAAGSAGSQGSGWSFVFHATLQSRDELEGGAQQRCADGRPPRPPWTPETPRVASAPQVDQRLVLEWALVLP